MWNAPAWLGPRLAAAFPDLAVVTLPGPRYEGIERELPAADAAIAWSIRPTQFALAPRLRWIHSPAAAVHQLMFPEVVASPVVVTNARTVHGPVVAEHALAMVFALAKRLPAAMQAQRRHEWAQQSLWEERPTIREIAGATIVLVGMGAIGSEFTARAKALGARVLCVREHPERGPQGADAVFPLAALDSVLPQADFVVLAAPLTPATHHLIDARRLACLSPSSYLINVARGPLIDDGALLHALRERRIAGAALDVFPDEPLPASSPYWDLPNVLITPHIAAVTEKLWDRHFALIIENLTRFLAGHPLLNVVDKRQGY